MSWFPTQRCSLADRLNGELWRRLVEENVGARELQADHLGIYGRIRCLMGLFRDNPHSAAQSSFETFHVVTAKVGVLVQDADLAFRLMLKKVFRKNSPLGDECRLEPNGPRKILWIAERCHAARYEQLRYLSLIHVFTDCYGTDTQALENQQDFVVFNELTSLFDPFGRVIGVVIGNELDPAAVDATLGIDLVEISTLCFGYYGVSRQWSTIGSHIADLDLGVVGTNIVF